MSDDLNPDDPFEAGLGGRMHATADHLDGAGVTRASVAGRIGRPGTRRWRGVAVGVAAALVAALGLGAVARSTGDAQHVTTSGAATEDGSDCAPRSSVEIGWSELTQAQVEALHDAGLPTESTEADNRRLERVKVFHLTLAHLDALDAAGVPLTGEQIWYLGFQDPITGELTSDPRLGPDDEIVGTFALSPAQRQHLGNIPLDGDRLDVSLTGKQLRELESAGLGFTSDEWPDADELPHLAPLDARDQTAVVCPADPSQASSDTTEAASGPTTTIVAAAPDTTTSEATVHRSSTATTAPATTTVPAAGPATTTTLPKMEDLRPPAGWPQQVREEDMVEGEQLWGVYLHVLSSTGPQIDGHDRVSYAEDRWYEDMGVLAHAGYVASMTPLPCDTGAEHLVDQVEGFTPTDEDVFGVGIYFRTMADAEDFVDRFDGEVVAVSSVHATCVDAPQPGAGFQRD